MHPATRFSKVVNFYVSWLKTPWANSCKDGPFNDICDNITLEQYIEKYKNLGFQHCKNWNDVSNHYFKLLDESLNPTRQAFYDATKEYNRFDDCMKLGRQTFDKLLKLYPLTPRE